MNCALEIVVSLQIRDNANDLRVEISGRFAGSAVEQVSGLWTLILDEKGRRQFTVDITNMSDYDHIGCTLLRDMHKHGVHIAAASAGSLKFLAEISARQRPGPSLVKPKAGQKPATGKPVQTLPRFAASGE
jgi:hypothetical protein